MNLPPEFIKTIHNTFSNEGRAWLGSLPGLVREAARRWGLKNIQPVPELSYNFVAFALRPSTSAQDEVVLKICVPSREVTSEMAALRLFNGDGAVRLLEADEQHAMFLLEHLRPGEMLSRLEDDEQATNIAADVMLNIRRPAPPQHGAFIQLSDWFKGLESLRARFEGGTGPLEKRLVERAEAAVKDFFAEQAAPMLIHGDLHHFNILSSRRGPAPPGCTTPPSWLAIDPKGVIGPAAYEVGPLLMNPWGDFLARMDSVHVTERRIGILSDRLGLERERIRDWGIAHAVLSSWWSLEEGTSWEYSINCARVFEKAGV